MYARHRQRRGAQQRERAAVHHLRSHQIQHAAEHRAGDAGGLADAGTRRRGAREARRRYEVHHHGTAGRHGEGTRAAEQRQHQIDEPHAVEATVDAHEQQRAAERLGGEAGRGNAAAIVPVGEVPGRQHQQDERRELRQADEAELREAAGELVHLPADCDALHFGRQGGEGIRRQVRAQAGAAHCRRRLCFVLAAMTDHQSVG
jgi:hypothetical protein